MSWVFIASLVSVVLGFGAFVLGTKHFRRSKQLRAQAPLELVDGKGTSIKGTVELLEGSEYALSARVRQGEQRDDVVSALASQPFVLVMEDGTRVRCDLGDDFDLFRPGTFARRVRPRGVPAVEHRVVAGDELEILGVLRTEPELSNDDYRGGMRDTWVLQATEQTRALVVTKQTGERSKFVAQKHLDLSGHFWATGLFLLAPAGFLALQTFDVSSNVQGIATMAVCSSILLVALFAATLIPSWLAVGKLESGGSADSHTDLASDSDTTGQGDLQVRVESSQSADEGVEYESELESEPEQFNKVARVER